MADACSKDQPDEERVSAGSLFREHAEFVARFLQRLGAPPAELDDWVQEVFVVAHRKGGYVPGPARPRSWLGAIALHVAQAGRRSWARRTQPDTPQVDAAQAEGSDPAETLEHRRSLERVQRALDQLPMEQRAAFILYELDGESCESIAAVWGVPVGTVYSRLHQARQRFLKGYRALTQRGTPVRLRPLEER